MKNKIIIIQILFFLTGCAGMSKNIQKVKSSPDKMSVIRPVYARPVVSEGSLWSDSEGVLLYYDRRARKIGDIVKVRIVEDPEARLGASTSTSRSSQVGAAKLAAFGWMKSLARHNPGMAQNPGTDDLFSADLGMDFDGEGSSDRDGYVKAYVPTEVMQVLPNGNLLIAGQREIKVNNETQYLRISGIIRAEDISQFNEISSSSIASARIEYSGSGVIADKQKPGWAMRIIDYVWPF